MRLSPAIAATRLAVRRCLAEVAPDRPVLAAVSGGPDSMALAAALAFEAQRGGRGPARQVGLVTVDHGLQPGSAERARALVGWAREHGFPIAEATTVAVAATGSGLEADARTARYQALAAWAARYGAGAVLLGHTEDDQAETVLLRLARGSGSRSLAGIPPVRGVFRRPFLDLPRAVVHAAAEAQQLPTWSDPLNDEPRFTRTRVRTQVMPALQGALGDGARNGLARSATLLRDDADALDEWALREAGAQDALSVAALAGLPRAVRTRVIRLAAVRAGCPAGRLAAGHVHEIDRLVTDWHGQGAVALPGGLVARRRCGRLRFDAHPGDRASGRGSGPGDRGRDRRADQ